jgi:hypothetical protein
MFRRKQHTPQQPSMPMPAIMPSGRTSRREGRLSPEPVSPDTTFSIEERTFQDPVTGHVITLQESTHWILACGCTVSSPQAIRGVCSGCASYRRNRYRGKIPLVCHKHTLCLRCRRKNLKRSHKGIISILFFTFCKLLLWPFGDLYRE